MEDLTPTQELQETEERKKFKEYICASIMKLSEIIKAYPQDTIFANIFAAKYQVTRASTQLTMEHVACRLHMFENGLGGSLAELKKLAEVLDSSFVIYSHFDVQIYATAENVQFFAKAFKKPL
jgi:hypothetical protein